MYANGEGVTRNDEEAAKWIRKAADQGDPHAQNNLGVMYATGRGLPKDYAEAEKWFRLAADSGDAKGKENLEKLKDLYRPKTK